jgi:alpha-tubulin suppressor-like RCC1 family protein
MCTRKWKEFGDVLNGLAGQGGKTLLVITLVLAAPIVAAQTDATPRVKHAAAHTHALILLEDGRVLGWGVNNSGQLGEAIGAPTRNNVYVTQPIDIPLPRPALQVAVGAQVSYALMDDGTVMAWGRGFSGQLGNGREGLRARTKADQIGSDRPVRVTGIDSARQIVAYDKTALALLKDGRVVVWGMPEGLLPADAKSGLTAAMDGNMVAAEPVVVPGLSNITRISLGTHGLALRSDGRLMAWGSNQSGQLGNSIGIGKSGSTYSPTEVAGLRDVVAMAAGPFVSTAVLKDGSVWTWGSNMHGLLALAGNDGLPAEDVTAPNPRMIEGISHAVEVQTGDLGRHTVVLMKDGSLRAWGNTDWGQIGAGVSGIYQPHPQKPRITGVKSFWASGNNTFAVRNDGTFWFWGSETSGKGLLGKNQKVPVKFPW